jgi:glycine C-acetyltransferase
LGLSNHPLVKEAAIRALEKYGVGTGNSRFLTGTNDIHLQLERAVADFRRAEDCFIFSSGYNMNVGAVSCLLEPGDVAIVDEKVHISVFDGCRLSGAELLAFRHNDMKDLEKKLSGYSAEQPKLLVTDGIFSMDGDIGRVDEIIELGQKYNAAVYVDDAHANGVLGKTGRGSGEHFNMNGKIEIVVGTLSKAFGGLGGFVTSKRDIIKFIKHKSRTSIFSTGLPPVICASVIKAIEIIDKNPNIVKKLWDNARYFREKAAQVGFDTGLSETPIVPIIVKKDITAYNLTGMLNDRGICVSAFAYPAVKRNEARIRVSLMSDHTQQELDYLLEQLKECGAKLGIIA